jgi:hypothetical protein
MNSTVNLIFTVAVAALVLLTAYGAFKLDRKVFLSGICFFSLLPIIGESMAYSSDKAPIHILVIFVFLAQVVLTLPNAIVYGQDNTAAVQLSSKIAQSLVIINAGGAVFILYLNANVPAQFGYYHIAFVAVIVYLLIKRSSGGGWLK